MDIKAIDVSSYQGKPNWEKVAKDGIKIAVLRITQRDNNNAKDSSFEHNFLGCRNNGIKIGVYKFSYAMTTDEAKKEAESVVNALNGRGLDLPVFLDLEYSNQRNLSKSTLSAIVKMFRGVIVNAGYKFAIYCNTDWYNNVIPSDCKDYDYWLASYPANDNGTIQERLRPSKGIAWQYSSKGKVDGISGYCDMDVFYTDYSTIKEVPKIETKIDVEKIRKDAVDFAVKIANDNKHGYSQITRSLFNYVNPKSFDCSSLVITSWYYAFIKNGLNKEAEYLKEHCSYTGNMLYMKNIGFEVVATNQTNHNNMILGDIELNTVYHTAMAIDSNNIVHARTSEGTEGINTIDDSGNEIRTQAWYKYSQGWTHRLRFTGKGINEVSKGVYMFSISREIKKGCSGKDVKLLQTILRGSSYRGKDGKPLALDGEFGDNSDYALKSFQKKKKLVVDGVAGANTWSELIGL